MRRQQERLSRLITAKLSQFHKLAVCIICIDEQPESLFAVFESIPNRRDCLRVYPSFDVFDQLEF